MTLAQYYAKAILAWDTLIADGWTYEQLDELRERQVEELILNKRKRLGCLVYEEDLSWYDMVPVWKFFIKLRKKVKRINNLKIGIKLYRKEYAKYYNKSDLGSLIANY